MKKVSSYRWCIIHIDSKFYSTIGKELKDKGYKNMRVCVPTVRILKKRQKGKDIYEDIPILFNYGFIRLPREKAYNRKFLSSLRKDIRGIHSWVKSLDYMHPKKRKSRIENAEDHDDYSMVATVTWEQVKHFKRLSRKNQAYSKEERINLKIGDYIILRGYPFEGVDAVIKDVNFNTGKLKVELYPGEDGRKLISTCSFENAIHSIYHYFDNEKLTCSNYEMDSSIITQEAIDDNLAQKQF